MTSGLDLCDTQKGLWRKQLDARNRAQSGGLGWRFRFSDIKLGALGVQIRNLVMRVYSEKVPWAVPQLHGGALEFRSSCGAARWWQLCLWVYAHVFHYPPFEETLPMVITSSYSPFYAVYL